jgi:hypothetical protein
MSLISAFKLSRCHEKILNQNARPHYGKDPLEWSVRLAPLIIRGLLLLLTAAPVQTDPS